MKFLCLFFSFFPILGFSQGETSAIFSNKEIILAEGDYFNDTNGLELSMNSKKVFAFSPISKDPNFYYFFDESDNKVYYFFQLSGDTTEIKFINKQVIIVGRNAPEQELLTKLEKENASIFIQDEGLSHSLINDFDYVYNLSKETFVKRNRILSSYKEQLRPQFYELLKKVSVLKRLDYLLSPYNPCSPQPNFKPVFQSEKYFLEIETLITDINQIDSSYNQSVSIWLSKILRNYSNFKAREVEDESKFESKFKSSIYFKGSIKDLYLSLIMIDKLNNSFINSHFLSSYYSECKNINYKTEIRKRYDFRTDLVVNQKFLDSQLFERSGKKSNWSEILKMNVGKVVYIDFWASWCAGCKLNIPKIKEMKNSFPELKVVFISKDIDVEKWQKSIKLWGIEGMGTHFNLNPDTELSKILTEPSIPRGTLIDKDGRIVSIDTDEPNSKRLNDLIKSLLK